MQKTELYVIHLFDFPPNTIFTRNIDLILWYI